MTNEIRRGRGLNYLGELGSKLRDLKGTATLAHELIQNAEDAIKDVSYPSVTEALLVFRIDEHALIVDNGGVFSDCGEQDEPTCPWRQEGGRPCDFHSFRDVGGAAKRSASSEIGGTRGLKGAFGFGFTAVYQVTDHPQIISNGRHWILEDDKPEQERILECNSDDCEYCKATDLPGTRFVLPWAFDNSTSVRRGLNAPAVTKDKPNELVCELQKALPQTVLFLDYLRELRVLWKENQKLSVSVDDRSQSVISVTTNGVVTKWALLEYDFEKEAVSLRKRHPEGEKHPSSLVKIAIPQSALAHGLFFAYLPTQLLTQAPFHVNADFFPSNDRKRLILEDDYQGDWNRTAIKAGAKALSGGLLSLRSHLGPAGLWDLIQRVYDAANDDESLLGRDYWDQIVPILSKECVVPDQGGNWQRSSEVRLLTEVEIGRFSDLHRELGILSVHPEVAAHKALLISPAVRVSELDSRTLASKLRSIGLSGQKSVDELPNWFQKPSHWNIVWQQIAELLQRESRTNTLLAINVESHVISDCCVVKCIDGTFRTCQATFQAEPQTRSLFGALSPTLHFASDDRLMHSALGKLIPNFAVSDALSSIASFFEWRQSEVNAHSNSSNVLTNETAVGLLAWFNCRVNEFHTSPHLIAQLKTLSICPTANGLQPFDQVVLPGGFSDPIGVTSVADSESLESFAPLFQLLKLKILSLNEYVTVRLPEAFEQWEFETASCIELLQMLSMHQGELYKFENSDEIRSTLRSLEIIPCDDGILRSAKSDLYFPLSIIKDVLADSVSYVEAKVCSKGVETFLEWIGIESKPRLDRVVEYMFSTAKQMARPTQNNVEKVVSLLEHVGSRLDELENNSFLIAKLRANKWIPTRKMIWNSETGKMIASEETEWAAPNELHHYRTRHLVETIAVFAAFPAKVQDVHRVLLVSLGMCDRPKATTVIKHLRHASQFEIPVDTRLYQTLNKALDEREITPIHLRELRSHSCLFDKERQQFVRPKDCFSEKHPFGLHRVLLGSDELNSLTHLLSAFDIRPHPSWTDAVEVIREISMGETVRSHRQITNDDKSVVRTCWKMIEDALHDKEIPSDNVLKILQGISDMPVVCRTDNILDKPQNVFFRDREQLAEAFSKRLMAELIPMPQGATEVLTIVGVRRLSEVTNVRIIHDEAAHSEAVAVLARIQERSELLVKITETYRSTRRKLAIPDIDSLSVFQSSTLSVELTFGGFEKPLPPVRHDVLAAFEKSSHALWFCLDGGEVPWDSIACEMSRMCLDDDDVAQLSAAMNAALEPNSLRKAQRKLSQLGFPSIELCEEEHVRPETSLSFGLDAVSPDSFEPIPNHVTSNSDIASESIGQTSKTIDSSKFAPSSEIGFPFAPSSILATRDTSGGSPIRHRRGDMDKNEGTTAQPNSSSTQKSYDWTTDENDQRSVIDSGTKDGGERFVDWLAAQPGASERRKQKILETSSDADRRRSEFRLRKQRRDQVSKEEVLLYLTSFYSKNDRLMCQMMAEGDTDLHEMPFWKSVDQMYSGKEELFNRQMGQQLPDALPETKELNLLLCPNCAAIYTKFIAAKPEQQMRLFEWVRSDASNETFNINCSLSGKQPNRSLVFHPKHLDDIRNVDGVLASG